jgi:hypothetical protein
VQILPKAFKIFLESILRKEKMKLPTKESIENSMFIKWFKTFNRNNAITDFLAKAFVSIIVLSFSLIPFWGYLLSRWFIQPADFWQEFAVLSISILVLGIPQIIMIIFGGVLILNIIIQD